MAGAYDTVKITDEYLIYIHRYVGTLEPAAEKHHCLFQNAPLHLVQIIRCASRVLDNGPCCAYMLHLVLRDG